MTADVKYCFEDEEMDHMITTMADIKVRRLPVMSRDKRLVGMVAAAGAVIHYSLQSAGAALEDICAPGGAHANSA